MNQLKQAYYDSQIDSTLKWGRITSIIIGFFVIVFLYVDLTLLKVPEMLGWRLMSIAITGLYIIGSYTWLKTHKKHVIPAYTIFIASAMVMMLAISYHMIIKTADEQIIYKFAGTLACITGWFCIPFTIFGSARYLLTLSICSTIIMLILVSMNQIGFNIPFITTILLVSIISNLMVWQKNQLDFRNFETNKQLKEKEEELRLQNLQISTQNNQLTTSNSLLENFARSASHDLKEPLRMISSFGGLIQKRAGHKLDTDNQEYLAFMINAASRMSSLIDDLLNFSKLKGMNFQEVEPVNLNQVMQTAISNLTLKIDETKPQLYIEELPTVIGKYTLLVQLFQNLIANAIKFQPTGQQAIIHIKSFPQDIYHVISVSDNGIGMNIEPKRDIFEAFTRLNPISQYEGTGIGLATCKVIAEGLKGNIKVESSENKGSAFEVYLLKQT